MIVEDSVLFIQPGMLREGEFFVINPELGSGG